MPGNGAERASRKWRVSGWRLPPTAPAERCTWGTQDELTRSTAMTIAWMRASFALPPDSPDQVSKSVGFIVGSGLGATVGANVTDGCGVNVGSGVGASIVGTGVGEGVVVSARMRSISRPVAEATKRRPSQGRISHFAPAASGERRETTMANQGAALFSSCRNTGVE